MAGEPALDWLLERPLAHRGLWWPDGLPENSLAAFAAAADAGVPVELDVHHTADGHPVVVHDEELQRLTGRPLRVSQLRLAELADLPLAGSTEVIPTLDDVLAVIGGRVGVMVEIKNHTRVAGPLEAAVATRLRRYPGPAVVASFNPRSVAWFAEHEPGIPRGQTAGRFDDVVMPGWLRLVLRSLLANRWTRPHYLSFDLRGLPDRAVTRWRERGLPLITWTVRSPADVVKARAVADGFIYEEVALPPARPSTCDRNSATTAS